ncbi:MAG TPA: hypothetical protein VGN75_13695, partial [Kaistia sp.]|nr:hypothetical protein [Kaistia sp.]
MSSRHKRKGQSKFFMIPGFMYRSEAYQSLMPAEKVAYQELKWRFDGSNNGRIGLGCRELAEVLNTKSKTTATKALAVLVEKGFIVKTKASGFSVKHRAATEWRLTEYPCDVTGQLPTKEFLRWRAPRENKTQSSERDTQSSEGDTTALKMHQNRVHSPSEGTVKPDSQVSQSSERYTY